MLVYRISKCKYINDLSGWGAANFPGRWNSKGTYVLYVAATASLALLENVVHIPAMPAEDYCMATINIPQQSIKIFNSGLLPKMWRNYPPPEVLKSIGDTFVNEREALALQLPSAIMPEESIFLLNSQHRDFKNATIEAVRKMEFDKRLLKQW